jgi:hypothetical protein
MACPPKREPIQPMFQVRDFRLEISAEDRKLGHVQTRFGQWCGIEITRGSSRSGDVCADGFQPWAGQLTSGRWT